MSLVFGQPNGTVGPGAGAVEIKTIASPTVQSTGALTISFATPLKDAFVHLIAPLSQVTSGVYVGEYMLTPPITVSGNTVTVNIVTSANAPVAAGTTLTGVYVQVVAIH